MKRFRASIYIDIKSIDMDKAFEIANAVAKVLQTSDDEDLPEGYYNPYVGGVGEIVKGDLIKTVKNMEGI